MGDSYRAEVKGKIKGKRAHTHGAQNHFGRALPADRRTLRERTLARFAAWHKRVEAAKAQKRLLR